VEALARLAAVGLGGGGQDSYWGIVVGVLAHTLLLGLLWEGWFRRPPAREVLGLVALFGGALALRASLAVFGPGDLHTNLADVAGEMPGPYGPAPWGALWWYRWLELEGGWFFFGVNLIAGSLAPLFIQRALDRGAGSPTWGWLAALFVATSPLLVRFSTVANRQALMALLTSVALWGALTQRPSGRRWRLGLGACAAFLASMTRPEGAALLAVFGTLAVAVDGRRAMTWLVAAAPALFWLVYASGYGALWEMLFESNAMAAEVPSSLTGAWLDVDYIGVGAGAALLLSCVALVLRPDRIALVFLGGAVLVTAATGCYPTAGFNIANARYQTVALVLAASFSAFGIARALSTERIGITARHLSLGLVVVTLLVTRWEPLVRVTTPTTVDLEYRLLYERLPALEPDALVRTVDGRRLDAALRPPRYFQEFGIVGAWRYLDEGVPDDHTGPIYYYHPASCSVTRESILDGERTGAEFLHSCAVAYSELAREVVWSVVLPAIPLTYERWPGQSVRVGLYRVRGAVSPATSR
jgi:hypothetical protein